ncbi:enoyl-CoA hydratase/isomerase family protein [Streptomyces sp. H27-D2]|uniref:enoyl-CoA hydratase/isomerase family protein n=1 Tax=Streptomyces sp. H27-D2 TaxID=3046304 RepID=UPI002DBF3A11|nr:enoyl-CoA hydratase/isomerase family protein [Streptomyces sp. H27-D2]MEC4017899.1 enoyl-CoA hydratase/isomerase family protein [Streptomyces sp. H27-D2]
MPTPTDDATVLVRKDGRVGRIVLNRPRAINALTHPMVRAVDAALASWERDDDVRAVVITGAGERGLCAGGDVRAIREDALAGGRESLAFWRDEYRLNARVARYPKPYVAAMDGIVMGGGVGVSAHGSVRIVTERSRIAMPEVGIGFVPDVGGTWLLSRAPGEFGTHLALTAGRLGPADALLCGFADHFVPAERLDAFLQALATDEPEAAARAFAEPAPAGELAGQRDWIDSCYAADSVEAIVERLLSAGEPAAKEAAEAILGHSPTALKTTLRALRRARALATLEDVLDQEFRVSTALFAGPDLVEGVRAQVVDKDRTPRWSPPTLEAVTDEAVERNFAPLGDAEPGLGPGPGSGA